MGRSCEGEVWAQFAMRPVPVGVVQRHDIVFAVQKQSQALCNLHPWNHCPEEHFNKTYLFLGLVLLTATATTQVVEVIVTPS